MVETAANADPAERMLAELAELDLGLARHVQARALAAEEPAVVADLARAYQRIARSLRHTLALKAKLAQDRARGAREDRAEAEREHTVRVEARKAQVRVALERALWNEYESADVAEEMACRMDDLLAEDAMGEGFLAEPAQAYIARLRRDLGVDQDDPDDPEAANRPKPRGYYIRPVRRPDALRGAMVGGLSKAALRRMFGSG